MQCELVRNLYDRLIAAWNRRDAAEMAALYAPKGGQVGFDGSVFNTPAEIEAAMRPIFQDHPTARYVTIVREVRAIGENVTLLRAVAGMIPPGEKQIKGERNAVQTLVASQRPDGEWRIEMFHNTPARFDGRPDESAALTHELQSAADLQQQR